MKADNDDDDGSDDEWAFELKTKTTPKVCLQLYVVDPSLPSQSILICIISTDRLMTFVCHDLDTLQILMATWSL